ncbi:hypothetical protein GCM10023324_48730 [Streptomyces youssoufiensis]
MSVQEYEEDGRLICLSCGRPFALLAPHLARAHGMSSVEYREAYELPRRLSLRAAALTERAREQGRARYQQRPDIREAMERGRTNAPDTSAIPSSQETAMRSMVRAARKRGGQGHAEAARRRMEERVARVGFANLPDYFQARAETSISAMARELGASRTAVSAWRKRVQEA